LFANAAHDDLSGWPLAFHCGADIGAALASWLQGIASGVNGATPRFAPVAKDKIENQSLGEEKPDGDDAEANQICHRYIATEGRNILGKPVTNEQFQSGKDSDQRSLCGTG
jgi:hypothetical protein